MTYTSWAYQTPSGERDKNCTSVSRVRGYLWEDTACDVEQPFICQIGQYLNK